MPDILLILLYVLVTVSLLLSIGSWLRSLYLRDSSSRTHHRIPVLRLQQAVAVLLTAVLLLTSWTGVVEMWLQTIGVMLLVAMIVTLVGATGVLRKWKY